MNTSILTTRREFLRGTMLGSSLALTVPTFVAGTVDALHAAERDKATSPVTGKDSRILVVVQLAGGNDGLNTVVPYTDDHYHRARPHLGLHAGQVLKLDDRFGLHPALGGFRELHDAGLLGIVHAVGYPNPNRSHFRSMEIWATASDAGRYEKQGWLGRYFDHACSGADPTVGVAIGRQLPQAFAARTPTGVALENPQGLRLADGAMDIEMGLDSENGTLRSMAEGGELATLSTESGGSVGAPSGRAILSGSPLDFLQRTAMDARVSSGVIRSVVDRVKNSADYPSGSLGSSLGLVARLIGGGLASRIYYVNQGGYDTHTGQAATQERLLKELGSSLKAFMTDLRGQGNQDRVLILTFSEFGRRVGENASGGTDHGAAAPLFMIGGRVKPGWIGKAASLAPGDLLNGDVRFHTDFRSVYATVLEKWLRTPSAPVLGRQFAGLDLLKRL